MSKKIIFFDIDGTLYNPDIGVPESTKKAIQKVQENNHIPAICTGRSMAMINKELLDIGFQGVIAGAGTYVSYDGKVIHQVRQDKKTAMDMGELLVEGKINYILEGPEYIYFDSKQEMKIDEYVQNAINLLGMERFRTIDEGEVVFNKISTRITKESVIHPTLKDNYEMVVHKSMNVIEMIPKGYNKAVGIKKMIDYLGIDKKNTYAFGDSTNDIEMLEFVEYGVAMGNSYPEVKKMAKYTTKSIYEDGIYHGLKELGLI